MCIDVHVLSVIKASEKYETIAEGMNILNERERIFLVKNE